MRIRSFIFNDANSRIIEKCIVEENGHIFTASVDDVIHEYPESFFKKAYGRHSISEDLLDNIIERLEGIHFECWKLFNNSTRSNGSLYQVNCYGSIWANIYFQDMNLDVDDWMSDSLNYAYYAFNRNLTYNELDSYLKFISTRKSLGSYVPDYDEFLKFKSIVGSGNFSIIEMNHYKELLKQNLTKYFYFVRQNVQYPRGLRQLHYDIFCVKGVNFINPIIVKVYKDVMSIYKHKTNLYKEDIEFASDFVRVLNCFDDSYIKEFHNKILCLLNFINKHEESCESCSYNNESLYDMLNIMKTLVSVKMKERIRYYEGLLGDINSNPFSDILDVLENVIISVWNFRILCEYDISTSEQEMDLLKSMNVDFNEFSDPQRAHFEGVILYSVNHRLFKINELNTRLINLVVGHVRYVSYYITRKLPFIPLEVKGILESDYEPSKQITCIAKSCLKKAGVLINENNEWFIDNLLYHVDYSCEENLVEPLVAYLRMKKASTWFESDGENPNELDELFLFLVNPYFEDKNKTRNEILTIVREFRESQEFSRLCEGHPEYMFMGLKSEYDIKLYEGYKFNFNEHKFNDDMQRIHDNCRIETTIEKNVYKAYILDATDQLAYKVGEMTSCCQHLGGFGDTACVYSCIMPNSGVFVLYRDETLIAQAEVWLSIDNKDFIFDNIEFSNNRSLENDNKDIIKMFCKKLNKLGYRYFIGKGYNQIVKEDYFVKEFTSCNYDYIHKQPVSYHIERAGAHIYTDMNQGAFYFNGHNNIK